MTCCTISRVTTKLGAPVETITTSASTSSCCSSSQARNVPPTCSASARRAPGERFVTRMRSAPSTASAFAESAPISPAPTSRIARPFRSPKIFSTSSTATCDMRDDAAADVGLGADALGVAKARLHRRDMYGPAACTALARPYASFTWPRICCSPTTIESRLAATRKRWRIASTPIFAYR